MPKHARAFTLIEMVVALAIIGVLMAMALPMWTSLLERARMKRTQVQAKDLAVAMTGFGSASHGFLGDMGRLPTSTDELMSCPDPCPPARMVGALRLGWNGPYVWPNPGLTEDGDVLDGWRAAMQVRAGAARSDGSGEALLVPDNAGALLASDGVGSRLVVTVSGGMLRDLVHDRLTGASYVDAADDTQVRDRVRVVVSRVENGLASFDCAEIPASGTAATFRGLTPGYHLVEACLGGTCPISATSQCSRLGSRMILVPPNGNVAVEVPLRFASSRTACDAATCDELCGTPGGACSGAGACLCNTAAACRSTEVAVLGVCECAPGLRRCAPPRSDCRPPNVCCNDSECPFGQSCNITSGACVGG